MHAFVFYFLLYSHCTDILCLLWLLKKDVKGATGCPSFYLSPFSMWVIVWYREVIPVRNDIIGFLGLCFWEGHCLLSAFEASSDLNGNHGLSGLSAPAYSVMVITSLPCLAKIPHIEGPLKFCAPAALLTLYADANREARYRRHADWHATYPVGHHL